jgi:hypothetical protein
MAAFRLTDEYIEVFGKLAYLWGWPLVNLHNRRALMEQLPEPGLLSGIIPAAPPGRVGLLHGYVEPGERVVACPNQDVAYGFGMVAADIGPSVIQVPDFGERFWVYQAVDQRTDSFVQLGRMYGTAPGFYLLAPTAWDGEVPAGIAGVFRFDTAVGVVIPRVFLDDTEEDRRAIQPVLNRIGMYPLAEFDGTVKETDWATVPTFGDTSGATEGDAETKWVDPTAYFSQLGAVLDEVPAREGEEALYDWIRTLCDAGAEDPEVLAKLTAAAVDADGGLVRDLFEFRNLGLPDAHNWTTQRNGAQFGTDYLSRTSIGKSNIFVNTPTETCYYYQDLDVDGNRLDGSAVYSVTFEAGELPPVSGFWSLTLYNEHHFFHANDLGRYSLGTKNKTLVYGADGSLTLTAGGPRPEHPDALANWLPAPDAAFSLFIRAYWPDERILNRQWHPPAVRRVG